MSDSNVFGGAFSGGGSGVSAEETTVANLPAARNSTTRIFLVTDAVNPTISSPVQGGGNVRVHVMANQDAWWPLYQPEDTTGLPPYPPSGVTLTEPWTVFAHSYFATTSDGTRTAIPDLLRDRFVFGTIDNEAIAGQGTTQIADRVDNTDITIVDPDAGLSRAEQVAGYCAISMPRNTASNTAGRSDVMTTALADRDRAVAEFSNEYVIFADHTGRNFPIGSAVWAQCTLFSRTCMEDYPERTIDWLWNMQQYADEDDEQDLIDLFNGVPVSTNTTYADGSIDVTHPGTKGNKIMAYGPVWNWLRHLEQGTIWVPPFHEAWISGAAADTAITTSGAVYTVPFLGSGGSFSLVSGDATKFAVNSATGAITCVAGFTPAAAYYDLVVRATKGDSSVDCNLRLWIGKNTTGCDDRAVSRDTGGPIVFADAPTGITSKALSFVAGVSCGAGTDGDKMFLRGSESSAIQIYRDTDNLVKVVARNSSGTTIVSLASDTVLNVASGMTWVSISVDLDPVTPVATMYFNGTDVLAGGSTLTGEGVIDWNKRGVVLADSPSLTYAWEGTLRDYWLAHSYIDWSVSARRDERFNSGTLAAVALPSNGAINSVVPLEWTPGNLADLYWGRCGTGQNAGSGPKGVGCARHFENPGAGEGQIDGSFTPIDLGAKLLAWWSADDYDTANMTVETGDRLTAWVDRVSGVTLTQSTGNVARPTWVDNFDASGLAVVQFADTMWMSTTSFAALSQGTTAGRVFYSAYADGGGTLFSYGTNGANTLRRITMNGTFQPIASDGSVSASAPTNVTGLDWRVIDAKFSTGGHVLNVDGTQVAASSTAPSMNTGSSLFRLNANLATTAAGIQAHSVRQLVFTTDTLTTDEYQKLQAWLMWDQNRNLELPLTHPYRSYRP